MSGQNEFSSKVVLVTGTTAGNGPGRYCFA